jgi:hypothetical protein
LAAVHIDLTHSAIRIVGGCKIRTNVYNGIVAFILVAVVVAAVGIYAAATDKGV